eukprot:5334289-Prymnesium_polylepis.1
MVKRRRMGVARAAQDAPGAVGRSMLITPFLESTSGSNETSSTCNPTAIRRASERCTRPGVTTQGVSVTITCGERAYVGSPHVRLVGNGHVRRDAQHRHGQRLVPNQVVAVAADLDDDVADARWDGDAAVDQVEHLQLGVDSVGRAGPRHPRFRFTTAEVGWFQV